MLCVLIFGRPRLDGRSVSWMGTICLKDAARSDTCDTVVSDESDCRVHTIDSVRRTDALVRPSTRWETEDVGGWSWAPLRSPNLAPRLVHSSPGFGPRGPLPPGVTRSRTAFVAADEALVPLHDVYT